MATDIDGRSASDAQPDDQAFVYDNDSPEGPTDSLLVENGLRRTLHLREQLIDTAGGPLHDEEMTKAKLWNKPDTAFIEELYKAFRPEFNVLKTAGQITVEGTTNVVGAYGPKKNLSPSQFLYGRYYSEVDRTIVGILVMKWILAGEYETFTGSQHERIRLPYSRFEDLRKLFIQTFKNSRGSYMLIVSMIVNDLGKNKELRELIENEESRWKIMNHDEVIYYAALHGKIKLIEEFGLEEKARLMKGIKFGGKLNMAQLAQAENVPGSMKGIEEIMLGDEDAFPMKFCEVVLDVAGAAGHVDSRGANAWIEPVDQAYWNARECVLAVLKEKERPDVAYNRLLEHRATLLKNKGWKKMDPFNHEERAVLRLITMARAATKENAQKIEDAINSLPTKSTTTLKDFFGRPLDNIRATLLNGLSVNGLDDGVAIVPYYAPGIIAEAMRVTKNESAEIQNGALVAVFKLIARALIGTKPITHEGCHVIECDISFCLEKIRSSEFAKDPSVLDKEEYPTDQDLYSEDVESLMRKVYGIRRLERRRTGVSVNA